MAEDKDDEFDLVRLDKNRDFDKVTPPEDGAHFHQDNLYFGHDGRLAQAWLKPADKERVRRKVARAKAEDAANKARREALKKAGIDPDAKDPDAGQAPSRSAKPSAPAELEKDSATVDLLAWARGEAKVSWFKVRQAFVAQHAREVENKEDALIFLADQGLINADEVGV